MRSTEPRGHSAVLDGLWRAARGDRLAHALGFFGPAGVGKFLSAERLALGLLCARGPGAPCLACGPCKRALAGSHPDVLVLDVAEAELEEIPMAWITPRDEPNKDLRPPSGVALEEFLAKRPLEGGWRVALVRGAPRWREDVQNALLKTLEEPGDDVLLVLESARAEDLLATVRSRLVSVRFTPLDACDVRAVLESEARSREGLDEAAIDDLVRWSRGAPGRALDLARFGARDVWTIVGGLLDGRADALEAAAALASLDGEWPGRTPSAKARARARFVLDLVLEALGDVARARGGASVERVAHPDLAHAATALSDARLEAALERALEARQDVDLNLDPALAVERVALALAPPRTASGARSR